MPVATKSAKRPTLRRRPVKHAVKAKPPAFTPASEIAGQPPPDRYLLHKNEMVAKVGMSFPAIWRKVKLEQFPPPVEIGNRVAWYADEIEAWLNSLPRRTYKKSEG